MYALRERRVHVTQEDFEMAVAKVYVYVFFAFADGGSRAVGIGPVFTHFGTVFSLQVMQKDSEKNMSIKKLWK